MIVNTWSPNDECYDCLSSNSSLKLNYNKNVKRKIMNNKIENRPLEVIKRFGVFYLSDYDGSCCCLSFYICGVNIYCHCHRCGNCCSYSGIHVWQNDIENNNWNLQEIAEEIHKQIIEIWLNTEFEIKYEPYL